jgi:hypothetical protein
MRQKENFTAKAAKATKMNFLSQFFAAFVAFVVKFSFFVSRVRTSSVWFRLRRAVSFASFARGSSSNAPSLCRRRWRRDLFQTFRCEFVITKRDVMLNPRAIQFCD